MRNRRVRPFANFRAQHFIPEVLSEKLLDSAHPKRPTSLHFELHATILGKPQTRNGVLVHVNQQLDRQRGRSVWRQWELVPRPFLSDWKVGAIGAWVQFSGFVYAMARQRLGLHAQRKGCPKWNFLFGGH
jgi:hypothetical protein